MTDPTQPADPGHRHTTFAELQPALHRPASADLATLARLAALEARVAFLEGWREGVADAALHMPEAAIKFAVAIGYPAERTAE